MTDTLIKITASTKLKEGETYGIKGFEAKVEICKSRHAPAGRAVNMIYDQINGFRNDLSILDYIKSNGRLKGNGMAYFIEGYDKVKFKMSNFVEKLNTEKEFRDYFYKTGEELFRASIKESKNLMAIEAQSEETAVEEVSTDGNS